MKILRILPKTIVIILLAFLLFGCASLDQSLQSESLSSIDASIKEGLFSDLECSDFSIFYSDDLTDDLYRLESEGFRMVSRALILNDSITLKEGDIKSLFGECEADCVLIHSSFLGESEYEIRAFALLREEDERQFRSAELGVMAIDSETFDGGGAEIEYVIKKSPAYRAGLSKGDVIVEINKVRVAGKDSFENILRTLKGRLFDISFYRNGLKRRSAVSLF